ncbi:MAG: hypothetical protein WKI04_18985 [Ferruginibacter sp.]
MQAITVDFTKTKVSTVEATCFNPPEGTMTPAGKLNKKCRNLYQLNRDCILIKKEFI